MSNPFQSSVNQVALVPTVLGQGPIRISTGGTIRPGIKVLTKKANEVAQARAIYDQGVAAGQSFEHIEKIIQKALPELKTPLVPKNVPWFTVRGQDFPNPEIAKQILDAYGRTGDDGINRLYRFPVIFPSDVWQSVMPHELVAWGANERKFWSEYSPDGKARFCKCYEPVPLTQNGKRAIRIFGGRKSVLRNDNGGLCDPESCVQYQQRQCNLTGKFIFYIPGIKSISAFELPTTSFYAMKAAIQKFETIAFMRGGRISGFLDGARTPFYITKRLLDVPHIDEFGKAVRVPQWIIELEAPVDVTSLLRVNDDIETVLLSADAAVRTLEGGADRGDVDEAPLASVATADDNDYQAPQQTIATRCEAVQRHSETASTDVTLQQILDLAASYGLEVEQYEEYADHRWGSGWRIHPNGRRAAHDELQRYRNDARGFCDKVMTSLHIPQEEQE